MDELSCSVQPKSSNSKSSLSNNSNLSQTTEDDFNKTQLGENSSDYLLEIPKVKEIPQPNCPPLFNPFSIPIKETPSIPIENLGNNNKKEIGLSPKSFHDYDKFENHALSKQTVCLYESSCNNQPKNLIPKSNSSDKSSLTRMIKK